MQVINLRAYLANIGMTMSDFARIIGCHSAYISRIASGKLKPGPRLARDIANATSGVITYETHVRKKYVKKQEQIDEEQKVG